jgi:hypothetical protein
MTPNEFRKLALAYPGAFESSHMEHPDFRINGRIFATLGFPDEERGMAKLTPEQQKSLMLKFPGIFNPCNGAWGRQGATNIVLPLARKDAVQTALDFAFQNLAAKSSKTSKTTRKGQSASKGQTTRSK